jgi:capsular polysaccharide export protein
LEAIAKQSSAAPDIQAVRSSVKLRTIQAVFYYVAQTIAIPFFPHYRSHRRNSPASEMRAWIVRYFGRRKEAERSRREMANLGSKPFFLFPMQIDGDFQIIRHSDFADMSGTLDCVLNNFAGNAPADANLLVKMHPFDPDIDGWRAIVADKAQRFGVGGRVYFIERYDLEPLLHAAKGLVTVNSTVGPLALAAGCPVFCLGRAVYDIGGITAQCGLNEFWSTPPKVIAENFQTFCRALQLTGLINGGFHGNRALDMLITGAAERIGADSLAPLPLSD